MEAIREIDSGRVVIEIPEQSRNKKVEIIVFPFVETPAKKSGRFSRFLQDPIKIENFRMPSREER
ncbi:MAG: hypothetical protein KAW12_03515 [Candidatus Aminicenantes bacterium]|nr:hypothetical protein [Candidatus Aminicenantes bacterium]